MRYNYLLVLVYVFLSQSLSAQEGNLIINPEVVLPEDSIQGEMLLSSVRSFLAAAQEEKENKWILSTEKLETQLLVDEIFDIQKSENYENDEFYTPYLTNVIALGSDKYSVGIAYMGVHNGTAHLRATFQLIAHRSGDGYMISSPLSRNTEQWNTKRIWNQIFHYPRTADQAKLKRYYELTSSFDAKLGNNDKITHYYLCDRSEDVLRLFGVDYKSDYNGESRSGRFSVGDDEHDIFVMGADRFYDYPEHDIWHFRLGRVISRRDVHRRVDCHYATLYGGLWGKNWEELFPIFVDKYVTGDDVDWLDLKMSKVHFVLDGRRNYSDDFVGALLVEKVEKERGFDGVWQLLNTKRTKDEKEYFEVLYQLIGINKDNYNEEVYKLINAEMIEQDLASS